MLQTSPMLSCFTSLSFHAGVPDVFCWDSYQHHNLLPQLHDQRPVLNDLLPAPHPVTKQQAHTEAGSLTNGVCSPGKLSLGCKSLFSGCLLPCAGHALCHEAG